MQKRKTPLTLNRNDNTHILIMLLFHFEVTVSLIFLWQNHFECSNVNGKGNFGISQAGQCCFGLQQVAS